MSLDSNGVLELEVRGATTEGLEVVLEQHIGYNLSSSMRLEGDCISLESRVGGDHYYTSTVSRLYQDLIANGYEVVLLETEIIDEDGNHHRVILKDGELLLSKGVVVYNNYSKL